MSFFQEQKKMQEASTETDQLRSKTARQFAASEGSRYHECTLALVFLRCLRERLQFSLSCNDVTADKFDDLVLCWNDNESHRLCTLLVNVKLVSANHKTISISSLMSQEKANRRKGFDIKMYHESYRKIRESLDGGSYALVVSTNVDLDADARDMFVRVEPGAVPGLRLLDAGGSLYQLNPDSEDVQQVVPGDRTFVKHFFLFCNQRGSTGIRHTVSTELASLLGASDSWCELMCGSLLSSLRHWMNTQNFYITSSWGSWLDIVDTYIKKEVTTCNSVVTRIKYSNVRALRAHIERHNPAWIRPPGRGAAALTATKVHQIIRDEKHIVVSVARLRGLQEKVLRCWGPFCRWLVLVDDTEKSCDIQYHLMKLVGPVRRLIVVSHKRDYSFMDTFKSDEICDDTWKELQNVKIQLNSEQYSCCLEDLCDTKALKAMVDEKPEALAALSQLTGPVRMGQHLDPLPQNHINRQLISRMRVREEFFSTLGDYDVCIMDKLSYNHSTDVLFNNTVKLEELENYLCASNALWPLFGVTDNIDLPVIQMICSKFQNICVYVLSYEDDGWEILFLHRGSANIRPYVQEESRSLWQIVDSLNRRIIVDGNPGIGKSTLLLDIARQVKSKNRSWWILRINLSRYTEVFYSCSSSVEAVNDILLRVVYNEKNVGILEHSLLQHCLKEYAHIICLVDGFDEICPDYAERCLHALQQLAPCRGKMVVTTRPSETGRLEAALGVLAHSLPAFSDEELQRLHQGRSLKLGVTDVVVELLKIPLFSRMYAEALESGIVVDDIVSLYETFLERKFRRLYKEKWGEDLSKPGRKRRFERERKKQENHLGFLAVSHLLPNLEVPCTAQTSFIDRDELVRAGVIYQFIDDGAVFIHRTFAEHFLAKWCFSDDAKGHCANVYQAALSDNSLDFFVESFDRMASRGRPLLTAVLNGSESEVKSLLQEGADPAERDEMGRNSLHLAAAYSRDSALLWLLMDCLEVAGAERVGGSAAEPAEETWEAVNEVMVYEMGELSRLSHTGRTSKSVQVTSDLGLAEASGAAGLWAVAATDRVSAALGAEDDLLQWTPLRYAMERQRWRTVAALMEAGAQPRHLGDFQRGLRDPQELWRVFMEGGYRALFHLICGKNDSEWSSHIKDWKSLEVGMSIVCAEMSAEKYKEISSEAIKYHHWEVARLLQLKIVEMQNKSTTSRSLELELNEDTRLNSDHEGRLGSSGFQMLEQELMCSTVQRQTPAHGGGMPRDADGWTELHHAAATGDAEGVRRLIEAGADVNGQSNKGHTALHLAAQSGSVDCIKLLLYAGAAVNVKDKEGATPLHRAAVVAGNVNCIKLLLYAGAAVNMKDKAGSTPLHRAAELGRRQTVRLLLAAGADALAQNCEGGTPLHWAAGSGVAECVRLLLRVVKTLELKDLRSYTALHYATQCGDVATVKHLLAAGADTNAVNDNQETPLHLATDEGFTECVRLLLQAKADVAAKTKQGATALHWAVLRRHQDCVRCLLEAGADVKQVDEKGDTPLHWAAREGSAACIGLLLREGADVHQRNRRGRTPLHEAAWKGKPECVKLLLDAGADALAQDRIRKTPIQLAADRKKEGCLIMLNRAVWDRHGTTN